MGAVGSVNTEHLTGTLKMNHFLSFGERMYSLFENGKTEHQFGCLHLDLDYLNRGNIKLAKISVRNAGSGSRPVCLLTETFFEDEGSAYGFISPTKDVIFLTRKKTLYLVSGMFKNKPYNQSGVLKKQEIGFLGQPAKIPFSPIAGGEIRCLFTLEQQLETGETALAFSWAIASPLTPEAENNLLKKHQELKSTLAFSN